MSSLSPTPFTSFILSSSVGVHSSGEANEAKGKGNGEEEKEETGKSRAAVTLGLVRRGRPA